MADQLPLDYLEKQNNSDSEKNELNDPTDNLKEPESFQGAMQELKLIVDQLENVQGDLDKSVTYFQRGMFLAKWAEKYLDEMEEQITEIVDDNHV